MIPWAKNRERENAPAHPFPRILVILLLVAAIIAEGYYIFTLHDEIARQKEDLKNISVQLQTLKTERSSLHEELSSLEKNAGDRKDGNTPEGQH